MYIKRLLQALTLASILVSSHVFAEIVIIVNSSNKITSLSKAELGRLFLGKTHNFPHGRKAVPLNQILASPVRKDFDTLYLGKSESQIKSYWSRQMFSGEGTPPEEVSGDLDVIKKVALDAKYIGYVDESALNDAVKVITIE